MKLATNMDHLLTGRSLEIAAAVTAEAGFQYLDYCSPITEQWEAELEHALAVFEKNHLTVYQSHAPFSSSINCDPAEIQRLCISVDVAARLGSRYLVIHGDKFDFKHHLYSTRAALEFNHSYFAPVVEKAAARGICIAFENTFESDVNYPNPSAKVDDLLSLINSFGSDHVVCCWDFGHGANAYHERQPEAIRVMGSKIECTHVHDNYLTSDLHLPPFFGRVDWQACMDAIRETAKVETLSMEMVYGNMPSSAAPAMMKMLYCLGTELCQMAQ